jgi:hypothetical protein
MEKEEYQFSPLWPITLLLLTAIVGYIAFGFLMVAVPAFGYITPALFFRCLPGIIFSFVALIFIIKNQRITYLMLTRIPAIILTDKEITIAQMNSSLPWKDVIDVFMASTARKDSVVSKAYEIRYIIIKVRDPDKHIKKIKNPIIRYYRWYTRSWIPSPFEINLSLVKGDEDEIYHTVLRYYQNNRGF